MIDDLTHIEPIRKRELRGGKVRQRFKLWGGPLDGMKIGPVEVKEEPTEERTIDSLWTKLAELLRNDLKGVDALIPVKLIGTARNGRDEVVKFQFPPNSLPGLFDRKTVSIAITAGQSQETGDANAKAQLKRQLDIAIEIARSNAVHGYR